MGIVEKIPNPVLLDKVIQSLQDSFNDFSWMEICYPLAQVGIVTRGERNYRIPVVYRNDGLTYQVELFPDDKKDSFSFFEMESPITSSYLEGAYVINYNLNLVCWLNLPKTDPLVPFDTTMNKVDDVLAELKTRGVTEYSADIRNESVFSKYDYEQAAKQFMIYPYSGFKINFQYNSLMCL